MSRQKGIYRFLLLFLFSLPVYSLAQVKEKKEGDKRADSTLLEEVKEGVADNIPVISMDENEGEDGSAQNISSQLTAGRDPFVNAANFKFNVVRFRIRGYDADNFSTMMNGVPMENLDNGFTPFGLWGGLNDVMRNRDYAHGLRPTPYSFGDLGGLQYFDTRASYQRKQTNVNFAVSNRNYDNRLMVTHSTGLNKKGWAFSFSGSRRWADEGYVEGTFYDGWSFYAGADKRFNDRNLLSLVVFATPTKQGRQGSSVQEMLNIAGTNFYNSFWGYQNGRKRNASIATTFQPIAVLSHEWKINDKTTLLTAATGSSGKRSVSGLDWYNTADPRPDYYRYLPSYQEDPIAAQRVYDNMRNDVNLRQINWDKLYMANYCAYEVVNDAFGIKGNTIAGRRSNYVLENRVIGTDRFNFNSTLNTAIAPNFDFTGGVSFQTQTNHYYKELEDLLGGDFYLDINQFAERDFENSSTASQNDVNNPNRVIYAGDRFGYNYDINIKRAALWAQGVLRLTKVDLFFATEHSYTGFFRRGNVRSGLYPQNSFGKSATSRFYNSAVKTGVTYKLDGRNYFVLNAAYMSRAPFFENSYIAPRTRDFVQDNLRSEEIFSTEGGYVMNAPRVKLRAMAYYTQFSNQFNVLTFYHDEYRNFVNYAISNIGKVHTGLELGGEAKVYKGLSMTAVASIGRFYYNTRQNVTVTIDNTNETVLTNGTVYSKNFNVPAAQEAYSIGFDYRSPKFWFVNVNFNFFNNMFLDFNPLRRTESAVGGVDKGSSLYNDILDQTRLPSQFTTDVFAGWSWKMDNRFRSLKKATFLVFNLGINNIFNNQDIVTGGFEQLRFDFAEKNVSKFPNRLFYAYGTNFFASVGLRF